MTIAEAIYLLCAATSLLAAVMLLRQYRHRRTGILLWSCIGFLGLVANNVLLYVDLVLFTGADLSLIRSAMAAAGLLALAYGLVCEATT